MTLDAFVLGHIGFLIFLLLALIVMHLWMRKPKNKESRNFTRYQSMRFVLIFVIIAQAIWILIVLTGVVD